MKKNKFLILLMLASLLLPKSAFSGTTIDGAAVETTNILNADQINMNPAPTEPTTYSEGSLYWDSLKHALRGYDGISWQDFNMGTLTLDPWTGSNQETMDNLQDGYITFQGVGTNNNILKLDLDNPNDITIESQKELILSSPANVMIEPKLEVEGRTTSANFISTVPIGTQPYACTSNTLNANLNADLWDGYHLADYLDQPIKTSSSPIFVDNTLAGNLLLPSTTLTTGMIRSDGAPFIHNFGTNNVFVGSNSGNLTMSEVAECNVAVGANAFTSNIEGGGNIAIGWETLKANTVGWDNIAIGYQALLYSTGESHGNIAIGTNAAAWIRTGEDNIAIGYSANVSDNLKNATAIGYNAEVNTSNSIVLGGTNENAVNVGIGVTAPTAGVLDMSGALNFSAFPTRSQPMGVQQGGPGNVNVGGHFWAVTFTSVGGGETMITSAMGIVVQNIPSVVILTIPRSPTGTITRKVYRTVAGSEGPFRYVGEALNNTDTTFIDNVADENLGTISPGSNTTAVADFRVGGTSRMVIGNGGNVGIGTTTPSHLLDVSGVTASKNFISDVETGTQPYACISTTLNTNLNADLWDGHHFADYLDQAVKTMSIPTFAGLTAPIITGLTSASGNLTLQSTSNTTKGKILFGASAYDEANNRLGIGKSNPVEALDIVGNIVTSGTIQSGGYRSSDGTLGLTETKVFTVKDSDNNTKTHTVMIKNGLITNWAIE